MFTADWLAHPVARLWAEALLHFLWQGTLIAAAVAIFLRRISAHHTSHRYALALAGLSAMFLCPFMTFAWLARGETSPIGSNSAAVTLSAPSFLEADFIPSAAAELGAETLSFSAAEELPESFTAAYPWILIAWAVGVAFLSVRLTVSWIGTLLLKRSAEPLPAHWKGRVAHLCQRLGLRRLPQVAVSRRVRDAVALGFLRPVVLFPAAWLIDLSPDALEAVIAHELAHIRRWDLWVNLAQRFIEMMLFYHPAVWWLSRVIRVEREMCCDERAVSATHRRLEYVSALESVARRRAGLVRPAVAVTWGDHDMALLNRVRNVLGLSPTPQPTGWWPVLLSALIVPGLIWLAASAFGPSVQADDENKDQPAPAAEPPAKNAEAGEESSERAAAREESDDDDEERGRGDDGRRGPPERRDGDRRDGPDGRRPDGPPRDGDRRPDGPPRDGDRRGPPRDGERRDGDRPRPDGERPRPEAQRRDGDRPRPDGNRPGPRDDGRRPDGAPRDGDRRGPEPRGRGDGPPADMMRLLQEMRQEIEQLRREVRELREQRGGPRGEGRPEGRGEPRRGEGDRNAVPRPEGRPQGRPEGRGEARGEERGPGRGENRPPEGRGEPGRGERRGDGPPPDGRRARSSRSP